MYLLKMEYVANKDLIRIVRMAFDMTDELAAYDADLGAWIQGAHLAYGVWKDDTAPARYRLSLLKGAPLIGHRVEDEAGLTLRLCAFLFHSEDDARIACRAHGDDRPEAA